MQYLIGCTCPLASEDARYPEQIDVLISACETPAVTISPGGRFLRVGSYSDYGQLYYLDLKSMTRLEGPERGGTGFLSDELVLVSPRAANDYLFNLDTAASEPLTWLAPKQIPGGISSNGLTDAAVLLPLLRSATAVYVLGAKVVAVQAQFTADATPRNYIFSAYAWMPETQSSAETFQTFLEMAEIRYIQKPLHSNTEPIAASGELLARRDGIYAIATGKRIVENYKVHGYGYLYPLGWTFDEQGVVLRAGFDYLVNIDNIPLFQFGRVYQPVLLLKLPSDSQQ